MGAPARESDRGNGAMPVSLVCCGLMGTVVSDNGMVDRAYAEAIGTQGVVTGTTAYARCMAQVHQARGRPSADVLQAMFPDSLARAQAARLALERSFYDAVGRMGATPVPGAAAALDELLSAGVRICLITAFSRRLINLVIDALGWWDRVALALSADEVRRGFPWPDLMLSAMLKLGVEDVRETAVAHDTENGILSGRRAGAGIVAGVLTGPHSPDRLRRAGASHLIPSIAHLPDLLSAAGERPLVAPPHVPAAGSRPMSRVLTQSRETGTPEAGELPERRALRCDEASHPAAIHDRR